MKLLFIVCLGFVLNGFSVSGNNPCGDWEPYKDEKCFKILDGLQNFTEAEKSCAAQSGARLVSIASAEEQSFLVQFIFTTKKSVDNAWLGALYKGGAFHWSDGANLTFSNWMAGSPKNREDYCVLMHSEDEFKGKWADESCMKKNLVVCQKGQSLSLEALKTMLYDIRRELRQSQSEQAALKVQLEQAEQSSQRQIQNLSTLFEATRDPFPVGFIYVQLPKAASPKEMWPTLAWTEVSSDYEDVFFRVTGPNTASFGAVQEENSPRLQQVEYTECQYKQSDSCSALKASGSLSLP